MLWCSLKTNIQLEGKMKMQEDGTLPGSGPKVNLSAFYWTNSTLSYHVYDNTMVKLLWDLKSIGQE